jgi:hypothetical protein
MAHAGPTGFDTGLRLACHDAGEQLVCCLTYGHPSRTGDRAGKMAIVAVQTSDGG